MPVKVKPVDPDKPEEKIKTSDFVRRTMVAYRAGSMNADFKPTYIFESEAYAKGMLDDARIRSEIEQGVR